MNDRDDNIQNLERQIEGKNPVLEALHSGRAIEKIFVTETDGDRRVREILSKAADRKIKVKKVDKNYISKIAKTPVHQGIVAVTTPYRYASVDSIVERARSIGESPFVLVLDHIKDPHNFGAIIRTAEACGVHGIIIPKVRAVGITPTVVKASAGAVEHIPIARVTNIANTIDKLKELGLWIAGASMEGEPYTSHDFEGPIGIVVGSEGEGISRLVKEKCDFLLSIPMKGQINSLNVSVATSVLLYEAVRQRG